MPYFTRGLAEVGARVVGIGDQPEDALPEIARTSLSAYFQIDSFSDANGVIDRVRGITSQISIDQVESLWEPLMILAAQIREANLLPGMTVHETIPFRDKEVMKEVLDGAGIRTPRHRRCHSIGECVAAADEIGYPIIVKPIAGAGSADTYRASDRSELEEVAPLLKHVPEVSVEEFIEGEEFTFDTVCAGGKVLFENISWYRPRPLLQRQLEWVSPQMIALKEIDGEEIAKGREMGHQVIEAMDFNSGFTHMEWFMKEDGEVVFGEIGARVAGARTVDLMNFASDIDLFKGWAEAVVHGTLSQPIERKYNAATIFKRAQGTGRIQRIEGLGKLMAEYGEHIMAVDLLPLGAQRRNWLQTLISDGMVIVRHPDLRTTMEIADRVAEDLQMFAA
jgi:biotin carboxylase